MNYLVGVNEHRVEHNEVRAMQRAGTLERVVRNDGEAFEKCWDYLASSSGDSEDEQLLVFFIIFDIVFVTT